MEKMITAAQVAALIQVHIRTVYRLAEKGALPGTKIGRGWRFSKRGILALVSNRTTGRPGRAGAPAIFSARVAAAE